MVILSPFVCPFINILFILSNPCRSVEEIHDDGTPTTKTFEHVPSEIGAEEAEEVGVRSLCLLLAVCLLIAVCL